MRTDATDKVEALCLRKEVASDTVEASERIRFAAGSASVERESVAPDLGLFGMPAVMVGVCRSDCPVACGIYAWS